MTQTATDFPALESDPIEKLAIDTIRTLCIDAVQAANSGHPGTPMALAPVMYAFWQKLRFDPDHPIWSNRDRFVLSAGHASTLLYSMLHLAGVKSVNPQYEILGELAESVALLDRRHDRSARLRTCVAGAQGRLELGLFGGAAGVEVAPLDVVESRPRVVDPVEGGGQAGAALQLGRILAEPLPLVGR